VHELCCFFRACDKDDENTNNGNSVNATDQQFTMMANMGNQPEMELGQLAATKAANASVKTYGMLLVVEHTPVGPELDSIAGLVNLSTPDTLDAEHKVLQQTLTGLSGKAFDTTYLSSQVRDPQKIISLFENEAVNWGEFKIEKTLLTSICLI
jgi:putative membrane protein